VSLAIRCNSCFKRPDGESELERWKEVARRKDAAARILRSAFDRAQAPSSTSPHHLFTYQLRLTSLTGWPFTVIHSLPATFAFNI
jgi:hypothetical protein